MPVTVCASSTARGTSCPFRVAAREANFLRCPGFPLWYGPCGRNREENEDESSTRPAHPLHPDRASSEREATMKGRVIFVAAGVSLILTGVAMPMIRQSPRLGDPMPGLSQDELARFTQGKAVFSREFTANTGLGPFFNNVSCAQCHEDPTTGGAGAFNEEDVDVERHATAGDQPTCNELSAFGGPVFREQTTGPPLPPIPAEAEVHVGSRSTPMLFGFGLIEAIPESAILAHEGRAGGGRPGSRMDDSDVSAGRPPIMICQPS